MITAIRNHAQSWVVKVMLGIIMLTFVVSFSIGRFQADRLVLAKVGAREISVNEFNREYEQELDALRQRFGTNADAMAAQLNIRKQVFDRMINREVILAAAKDQGLLVTEQEVSDSITSQPYFRVNDQFDFATYRSVLAQNRITPEAYEERARGDLKAQKFQRNLLAGLVVGKQEVEQRYRIENEKVIVEAILMNPAAFKASVSSSPEAEKAYYEANNDDFMQPNQFKIKYFVLSLDRVESGVTLKERAYQRYYERNREERFSTPKRVRASHILKKLAPDASLDAEAKAREGLDKLLKQIKGGGSFEALAKKHSEDFTKNKGGDLGFFTREDMLPEFSEVAFSLEPGQVSGILRTNFGLHLIKVTEVEPGVVKSLEQVRPEIDKILRSQRAERKLKLEAERLPQRIGKDGLEAVAKEWKREALTSEWIDGTGVLKKLGSTQNLYNLIKNSKSGDTGVWQRNPVQGHVFYQIAERKKAYLKPFEDVKKQVVAKVLAERMAEAALQQAKANYKSIESYADFKAAAKKRKLPIITTEFTSVDRAIPEVGINREFQEGAFRLTSAKPFGLSIDGKTAHLMYLKKRYIPKSDDEETAKERITARIQAEWAQYFLQAELERLKSEIEIEVVTPELVSSL